MYTYTYKYLVDNNIFIYIYVYVYVYAYECLYMYIYIQLSARLFWDQYSSDLACKSKVKVALSCDEYIHTIYIYICICNHRLLSFLYIHM